LGYLRVFSLANFSDTDTDTGIFFLKNKHFLEKESSKSERISCSLEKAEFDFI
jgi:hypothetical protein